MEMTLRDMLEGSGNCEGVVFCSGKLRQNLRKDIFMYFLLFILKFMTKL